jgi:hypothetical protein
MPVATPMAAWFNSRHAAVFGSALLLYKGGGTGP